MCLKLVSSTGTCHCGSCMCDNQDNRDLVTGRFCECDDSECLDEDTGEVCGGMPRSPRLTPSLFPLKHNRHLSLTYGYSRSVHPCHSVLVVLFLLPCVSSCSSVFERLAIYYRNYFLSYWDWENTDSIDRLLNPSAEQQLSNNSLETVTRHSRPVRLSTC